MIVLSSQNGHEDRRDGGAYRLRSGEQLVGAVVDGELVGTAGCYRERGVKVKHNGRAWSIDVTERARGAGVGRTLMYALIERAIAIDGIEQIVLPVTTTKAAARSCYRSMGFQSFGCERLALKIGETYFDTEHMLLDLGESRLGT